MKGPEQENKIAIVGAGGHALIVLDILERMGNYRIVGFVDPSIPRGSLCHGYSVLGDDAVLQGLKSDGLTHLALGVGGFRNNGARRAIFARLKDAGFGLVSPLHPNSVVSCRASLGEGCCLFAGATVNPGCVIGDNVIIATNSSIDHETVLASHVLISAGCTIGGNVTIGEGSLVAIGATVVSGVRIGRNVLVAAGAVVVKDVEDGLTVMGIPARAR